MNILAFDLETTGIFRWELPADDPAQPRVVELGAVLCDDAGMELHRFESIVKPDGWTIPEGAAKVHGITTEIALGKGRPIAEILDRFDELLLDASLLVAFNLKFDDKGLRGERRRLGRPDGFGTIPVFCCMRGATPLCKIKPTKKMRDVNFFDYKTPKLSEAVKILLGREHVGAHGAMADALATKDLYFAFRDNHEFMAAGSAFKTNEASGAAVQDDPRNHVALGPPIAPGPGVSNTRVGGEPVPEPACVPCKWCGKPTNSTGTKMCDGCWELDHRIGGDIVLAERILQHYKSPKQTKPMGPPAVGVKTEPLATGAGAQPAGVQSQDGSTLNDLFKLY